MNKPLIIALVFCGIATATQAGVYSHYSFDIDYQDGSGNGRHGSLVDVGTIGDSGITTVAGGYRFGGGALNLSLERDYVAIPSKTFSSEIPYSISFWTKKAPGDTDDPALWDMVMGQRGNSNFFISLNDGTGLRWRGSSSVTARQADFSTPDDTIWHHHIITADNAQNITYYRDGAWVATATGKSTGFILDTIGEAYSTTRDFDFHGQIDEVWVFDETITATMATNLFLYNNSSGLPAASVLTYRFDGDSTDESPSTNNGTASGTAGLTTATNLVPVGTGALQLDGSDDAYVALSSSISFSESNAWSVAFWAQRDENGTQKSMVLGERNTTDDFIWLNDNFTGLRFRSSTAATLDFTVAQDLDLHHYALVANGNGTLSLYVDGIPVGSLSGNTSFTIDTVGQAYPTTSYHYGFSGILDETRVYQGALTGSEILALYNEKPQPPAPVVTRLRVFLQAGQSNADGRATPGDLPTDLQQPQGDIDFYYKVEGGSGTLTTLRPGLSETGQFGPEITFGHDLNTMLNSDSTTRVAVIKYANGGTRLATQWKAGGDATTTGDLSEYVTFQKTVTDGMAAFAAAYTGAVIEIEGMIWHQGESDTFADTYANAYAANLADFIADIRATYGANLPFVVGRLSTLQTALDATRLETVRQAQTTVAEADPFTGLVGTDPFPLLGDNLHYNADGQQSMGSAFARQLGYQLWIPGLFTPEQLAAGEAEPGVDADSDGVSNENEYIAGTLPGDAASLLQADLWPTGPNLFEIRYPGAANRLFAVESTTNLVNGEWIELLPWAQGNGAVVTRGVTNSGSQGFMRVHATLP